MILNRILLPAFIVACLGAMSLQVSAAPHAAKVIYAFGQVQATGGSIYTSGSNDGVLKSRAGETLYKHRGMFDRSPYQTEHDAAHIARVVEQIGLLLVGTHRNTPCIS